MRQGETQIQADVDIGDFTHLFLVWGNFHADETLLSPQSAGYWCAPARGQTPSSRVWSPQRWVSSGPERGARAPASPEQHPAIAPRENNCRSNKLQLPYNGTIKMPKMEWLVLIFSHCTFFFWQACMRACTSVLVHTGAPDPLLGFTAGFTEKHHVLSEDVSCSRQLFSTISTIL